MSGWVPIFKLLLQEIPIIQVLYFSDLADCELGRKISMEKDFGWHFDYFENLSKRGSTVDFEMEN